MSVLKLAHLCASRVIDKCPAHQLFQLIEEGAASHTEHWNRGKGNRRTDGTSLS
jgi:hypothetical protein